MATKQPKLGMLLRKGINNRNAFPWSERDRLRQEIDGVLLNVPAWSNIPTSAGETTYVPDIHFGARAVEEPVAIIDDSTLKFEASQESLLVTTLRDMADADIEVVESLLTDGGEQHPRELAENTGRGNSMIYRALQRTEAVMKNQNAYVSFTNRKFADEVQAIVE